MTDDEVNAFADRLWQMIEAGEGAAIRPFYKPDAVIWYNTTKTGHTVDEAIGNMEMLKQALPDQKIQIVSRLMTKDGFVQADHMKATLPNGEPFELRTCAIVTMEDGLVARVDEYLDSAELQSLLDLAAASQEG